MNYSKYSSTELCFQLIGASKPLAMSILKELERRKEDDLNSLHGHRPAINHGKPAQKGAFMVCG